MDGPAGHILVVEDNATTAHSLRLFLESDGHQVTWARTGAEALDTFRRAAFDLVLLDLMLPDVDGLSVCRTLRPTTRLPIVMLTARTSDDDVVEGLEAGADDYVCKPFGSKTLLARVRRCLRRAREPVTSSPILRAGHVELDALRRHVRARGEVVRLTRSEFDILHCLMRSPGRVFTRARIIEAALGADFDGFDRTIDTYIWSLRRKLGDRRDHTQLIVSEPGVGYRLAEADRDCDAG